LGDSLFAFLSEEEHYTTLKIQTDIDRDLFNPHSADNKKPSGHPDHPLF
jgi:hypothetical protein